MKPIPNNGIVDINKSRVESSIVHVVPDLTSKIYNRDSSEFQPPSSRRAAYQEINEQRTIVFDHDDDKYKRRPPGEWMGRWWK